MSSRAHSRHALDFTVSRMFSNHWLYMWTFTLPVVLDVSTARARWASLQRELVRRFNYCGVRVFELHEHHGLHVHVIAAGKYPIRPLRLVARELGWGRIHVTKRIKSVDHAMYVAKYLAKQERPKCFDGVRVWAVVGAKFLALLNRSGRVECKNKFCSALLKRRHYTRVRDVHLDSLFSRSARFARRMLGVTGIKVLHAASMVQSVAIECGDDIRGSCDLLKASFDAMAYMVDVELMKRASWDRMARAAQAAIAVRAI